MTSFQLGSLLAIVSLLLILALPVGSALAARKARLTWVAWAIAFASTAVAVVAAWWMIAPVQLPDGRFCMDGMAADGLLTDSAAMTDWFTPLGVRLDCMARSRTIVAWCGAAQLVAIAAWVWAVHRSRRQRGPDRTAAGQSVDGRGT